MDYKMKEFIRDMKILLTKLEYEDDKDTQMDIVDSIYIESKGFQDKFCK